MSSSSFSKGSLSIDADSVLIFAVVFSFALFSFSFSRNSSNRSTAMISPFSVFLASVIARFVDSSYLALSLVVTMQMHHQFKFVHTNKLSYWSNPGFYYTFLTYWTRFLLEPYIKNSNHIFRKNQYVLSPNIICLFPIISYHHILYPATPCLRYFSSTYKAQILGVKSLRL